MIVTPVCQPVCGPIGQRVGALPPGSSTSDAIRRAFAGGAQGGWYDPSDISTLFQDSAGTTPVTASGQPVGRISDKSGRGNHLIQSVDVSRPLFNETAGIRSLVFDGVNDFLSSSLFVLTASGLATMVAGFRRTANTVTALAEHSVDYAANAGSFLCYWDATGSIGYGVRGATINPTSATAGRGVPETIVSSVDFNLAGASAAANIVTPTINAVGGLFIPAGPAAGGGNFGALPLYVGARAGTSLFFAGNLYGMVIIGGATTARASAERYVAGRSGVTI